MPRREAERATIDQLAAFMEQVKSGRVSRSLLDAFLKSSGTLTDDDLAFAAERVKAEGLYRYMMESNPELQLVGTPPCPGVGLDTIERLKDYGFSLIYLPPVHTWKPSAGKLGWGTGKGPNYDALNEPTAAERIPITEGEWLAVETRIKDGLPVTAPDKIAKAMGFTSRLGHTFLEIMEARRSLGSLLRIPVSVIRLPTCEESSLLAGVFCAMERHSNFQNPGLDLTGGAWEWCSNNYGSQPGMAMGNGISRIRQIMPADCLSLENVSFRLVIHLNAR